jgi:hypothetical protein
MTDNKDDELAALKARVEELERAAKPTEPEKPFVPAPYQRYDPTEGMSMPPSALREMAQHPCNQVMRGVIQDRHAPTGRLGMIPSSGSGGPPSSSKSSTPGWIDPRPLGPQRNPNQSSPSRQITNCRWMASASVSHVKCRN